MRFLLFSWLILLPFSSVAQWISVNNGLYGGQVTSLETLDGNIYAGTPGGPYISTDDGQTWNAIFTGLDVTTVNDIAVSNGKVLLAVNGGGRVFVTTNQGASWQLSIGGLITTSIIDFSVTPGHVFGLGNDWTLNRSITDGATWYVVNTAPTDPRSMTASGSHLYLGTFSDGVFRSDDHGENWTAINSGLGSSKNVYAMDSYQNFVMAWTADGVYLSSNNGASWTNTGLPQGYLTFKGHGSTLLYSTPYGSYRSTDNGVSWSPMPELDGAECIVWHENAFLAGNYYGIYKSVNDGVSWNETNEGLTNAGITGLTELNDKLYASAAGVFRSVNEGNSWTRVSTGLPMKLTTALIASNSSLLVSFHDYGIYRSVNEGDSWTLVSNLTQVLGFARKGTLLFAGGRNGFYVSADDGATWAKRSAIDNVTALTVQGNRIFAGRGNATMLMVSDDDGHTWASAVFGLPASYVFNEALFATGGKVYVGPANEGLYVTDNNGGSWQKIYNGIPGTTNQVYSFAARGARVFAGTMSGVYYSDNAGVSWSAMNDQLPVIDIANEIGKLFGGEKYLFSGHSFKGVWRWSAFCNLQAPVVTVEVTETDTTLVSSAASGNQWYLDGVAIAGATNQTWKPVSSGTYTVIVTEDDCTSPVSNAQRVTRFIFEPLDPLIEMPNVFTPDGNSFNPAFVPISFQDIPKAYLQIFDRWGKRVYSTDDLITGWDGGDSPAAVYYYLITYKSSNGSARQIKGWVQLLR